MWMWYIVVAGGDMGSGDGGVMWDESDVWL